MIALVAFSLFIPLHTVITLHGTALLALYCLFLTWRAADRRSVFLRLALAGVLGLLITAFYWLPALTERDAIKLPLIAEQLGHIDVTRHLRPLSEVLALPQTADPTRQNEALPITLGWAQLVLAALGTLLTWRAPYRPYRSLMIMLWVTVAFLVFLNTRPSAWFWENIPLLGYTQFPWRALGLASLLLALMAAVGARLLWLSLGAGPGRFAIVAVTVVITLLYALPWTYTLFHDDVDVKDIRDVLQFEREGGQLALSSYAEYLPVSADAKQLEANRLVERFATSDVIPRLLPSATLHIRTQEWRGTSATLRLVSAEEQILVFDWLYVPGWAAYIDGQRIEVFSSMPAGLLALEAPAGQFELRVALEPTAAQSLASVLSGLGLAGTILIALLWRKTRFETASLQATSEPETNWLLTFAAIGIAVFLLKAVALDAADTPVKRARFGHVEKAETVANFGDKLDLLAVDIPSAEINGPLLTIKLYWRLHGAPLEGDYSSIIRMRDPQGSVVAEARSFAPGGLATSNWLPGAYIEDVIRLEVPPFTPQLPESYTFDVGLYDVESLRALSLINAAGDPQDVEYQIAQLPLRWSEPSAEAHPLRPLHIIDDDDLALLFAAPTFPAAATAGDSVRFSWVWQKLRETASDAWAQVVWLDDAGNEVAAADALPLVNRYDFADWRVGEVNRGHHLLIVPPTLPAGIYGLGIRPRDEVAHYTDDIIRLEQAMTVTVPQREFAAPRFALESGAKWVNGIVLHGFSILPKGEIELVWGTNRLLNESLRLFVHALDTEGRIAAQWDGVPADWTRPTTGWIEGEYVTTKHSFSLPAGEYRLRLGWYAPATGARIGMAEEDALEVEQMLLIEKS